MPIEGVEERAVDVVHPYSAMDPLERRRPPPVRSAALSAEGPSSPQQKLLSSPILADFPMHRDGRKRVGALGVSASMPVLR